MRAHLLTLWRLVALAVFLQLTLADAHKLALQNNPQVASSSYTAQAAAQVALEGSDWKRMRPADRERLLFRLADAVEADQGHPAELDSWTMAKL